MIQLPSDQLDEVAKAENRANLVVNMAMDDINDQVMVRYGDGAIFLIPKRWFTPSGTASPNFDLPSISDYGHGIVFGEYEACAEYARECAEKGRDKLSCIRGLFNEYCQCSDCFKIKDKAERSFECDYCGYKGRPTTIECACYDEYALACTPTSRARSGEVVC